VHCSAGIGTLNHFLWFSPSLLSPPTTHHFKHFCNWMFWISTQIYARVCVYVCVYA
jgi:hypothetical protein